MCRNVGLRLLLLLPLGFWYPESSPYCFSVPYILVFEVYPQLIQILSFNLLSSVSLFRALPYSLSWLSPDISWSWDSLFLGRTKLSFIASGKKANQLKNLLTCGRQSAIFSLHVWYHQKSTLLKELWFLSKNTACLPLLVATSTPVPTPCLSLKLTFTEVVRPSLDWVRCHGEMETMSVSSIRCGNLEV